MWDGMLVQRGRPLRWTRSYSDMLLKDGECYALPAGGGVCLLVEYALILGMYMRIGDGSLGVLGGQ